MIYKVCISKIGEPDQDGNILSEAAAIEMCKNFNYEMNSNCSNVRIENGSIVCDLDESVNYVDYEKMQSVNISDFRKIQQENYLYAIIYNDKLSDFLDNGIEFNNNGGFMLLMSYDHAKNVIIAPNYIMIKINAKNLLYSCIGKGMIPGTYTYYNNINANDICVIKDFNQYFSVYDFDSLYFIVDKEKISNIYTNGVDGWTNEKDYVKFYKENNLPKLSKDQLLCKVYVFNIKHQIFKHNDGHYLYFGNIKKVEIIGDKPSNVYPRLGHWGMPGTSRILQGNEYETSKNKTLIANKLIDVYNEALDKLYPEQIEKMQKSFNEILNSLLC